MREDNSFDLCSFVICGFSFSNEVGKEIMSDRLRRENVE